MVAMLREIAPAVTRAAIVSNPRTVPYDYFLHGAESAGPLLGLQILPGRVENTADIERTIESLAHIPGGGMILPPDTTTVVNREDRARDRNRPNRNAACEGRPGAAGCEYVASLQARSRNVLRRGPVSVWAWQLESPERNRGRAIAIVVGRVGSASVFRSKAANARALRLDPFLCPDTLGAPGVHRQSPGMASQPSQLRGLGGEAVLQGSPRPFVVGYRKMWCPSPAVPLRTLPSFTCTCSNRAAADAIATTLRSPPRAPSSLLSAPP